jgi:hypothetical protein
MAPGNGRGYNKDVMVVLDGRGELPAEVWSDYGVPLYAVSDIKAGARTIIYRNNGSKLVIESRHRR